MNKKLPALIVFILLVVGAVYLYKNQDMSDKQMNEGDSVGVNITVGEGGEEVGEKGADSSVNISIGEPVDNDASVNITVGEATE